MSGMGHEEEYLNIEGYIVKGEGFLPFSFLCKCRCVYSFLDLKYIPYYTADAFYYNLL